MSGHTPGPWTIDRDRRNQKWWIDAPNGDPTLKSLSWKGLAIVYGQDNFPKEGSIVGEANARLIAAAPDLLEACKKLMGLAKRQGWVHVSINYAEAAIAKAENKL
jgi:hypothetical protein